LTLIEKYEELNPEFFRVHQSAPAFWLQQGMCIHGKYESIMVPAYPDQVM